MRAAPLLLFLFVVAGCSGARPTPQPPPLVPHAPLPAPEAAVSPSAPSGPGLLMRVEPSDAEIYLDGVLQGFAADYPTASQPLRLEAGLRRIELRKDGHKTWRIELEVGESGLQTIAATLERIESTAQRQPPPGELNAEGTQPATAGSP